MGKTLAASVVYALILLATRVVGDVLRYYLLAPMLGHGLTAALQLPVVLLIAWISSRALIGMFRMRRNLPHAAAMGLATFLMLILAETLLAAMLGDSVMAILRSYARAPAWLGLVGAFVLAFFPAIQVALSQSRHR